MASGHVKVKKGTGHVKYMATPSHNNESVARDFSKHIPPNGLSLEIYTLPKDELFNLEFKFKMTFRGLEALHSNMNNSFF